jgi:hypothetical protein
MKVKEAANIISVAKVINEEVEVMLQEKKPSSASPQVSMDTKE